MPFLALIMSKVFFLHKKNNVSKQNCIASFFFEFIKLLDQKGILIKEKINNELLKKHIIQGNLSIELFQNNITIFSIIFI